MNDPRYCMVEFMPQRWHIIDRKTYQPVYDDEPHGNDAPVVWRDEDAAYDALQRLNQLELVLRSVEEE